MSVFANHHAAPLAVDRAAFFRLRSFQPSISVPVSRSMRGGLHSKERRRCGVIERFIECRRNASFWVKIMRPFVEHLKAAYSSGAGILAHRNGAFTILLNLALNVVPVRIIVIDALPRREQRHPNAVKMALESANEVTHEPIPHSQRIPQLYYSVNGGV